MDDISRRLAEKLGYVQVGSRWHTQACQRNEENCGGKLPDFLSPAIFFVEYLKWAPPNSSIEFHHLAKSLAVRVRDGVIWKSTIESGDKSGLHEYEGRGATATEAGCLAWLAALNSHKGGI